MSWLPFYEPSVLYILSCSFYHKLGYSDRTAMVPTKIPPLIIWIIWDNSLVISKLVNEKAKYRKRKQPKWNIFCQLVVHNDKLFPLRRVTTRKGCSCDLRQKWQGNRSIQISAKMLTHLFNDSPNDFSIPVRINWWFDIYPICIFVKIVGIQINPSWG